MFGRNHRDLVIICLLHFQYQFNKQNAYMELRQLRHLIAVVEYGSFSRAADAVHLSQPALTRSIQALEASVGAAVLDRNRGEIAPTEVGALLLNHARLLDSAARDLERDIAMTKGLELGELRIGVGPYGGSALAGAPIGMLIAQHPRLRVKTVLAPWQELPARARARELDLIVVELSQVEQMEDFGVQALSQHSMVAVCRKGHPLTAMLNPGVAEVFSFPCVGPTPTPQIVKAVTAALPVQRREQLQKSGLLKVECDLSGMLKDVLRHSDAISLMPHFIVAEELSNGGLVALKGIDTGLRVRFGCAWLKKRSQSLAATRFMELLQAHDQQMQADLSA